MSTKVVNSLVLIFKKWGNCSFLVIPQIVYEILQWCESIMKRNMYKVCVVSRMINGALNIL